jgi:DNA-binding transcriptional MerR regulator
MFKIGEFSKLSNISVRSLRHYESLDLLSPQKTDPLSGYRYYTADQLDRANTIRMLREIGFSLDSIRRFLNADNFNAARQYFELRQLEVEEELKSIQHKKEMLRLILEDMEKNNSIDCFNVVEKDIPRKTVLSAYRVLPTYAYVKDFWSEFFAGIRQREIVPKEPLFLRSLCLDKEFKESDVEVELHIEVTGNPEGDDAGRDSAQTIHTYRQTADRPYDAYKVITTPASHAVTVTFDGGDRKNGHAVRRALARWLEVNGYGLDGIMFNTPHLSTLDDPDPGHWVNEWGFNLIKRRN